MVSVMMKEFFVCFNKNWPFLEYERSEGLEGWRETEDLKKVLPGLKKGIIPKKPMRVL